MTPAGLVEGEHRQGRGANSREAEIFLKILFKNIYILFRNMEFCY
jgi:hypothetical protein